MKKFFKTLFILMFTVVCLLPCTLFVAAIVNVDVATEMVTLIHRMAELFASLFK